MKREFQCDTLSFSEAPVDQQQAFAECDLVILNATHGSLCEALLAGKSLLLFPLHLEQILSTRNVLRLGAGAFCPLDRPDLVEPRLDWLLSSTEPRIQAREFAQKYSWLELDQQPGKLAEHLLSQL